MTRARKELVSISDTPYYHVYSRCVRRAFLCGFDSESQRSYEHRKQWLVDRIRLLSSLFSIDICAYAVMSNHYHIVLKLCPEQAGTWSDNEVLIRWTALCKGPLIVQKAVNGKILSKAESETLSSLIKVYRNRLTELSWFMKFINEYIARAANQEDNCTGHFWEARYHSKALCSEEALLTCMTYVDLNPIRAGIASTPETSTYTSISERINSSFNAKRAIAEQQKLRHLQRFTLPIKPLLTFQQSGTNSSSNLPFEHEEYLKLVDWTGRAISPNKQGHIETCLPPILARIKVSQREWLNHGMNFQQWLRKHRRRLDGSSFSMSHQAQQCSFSS